MTKSIIKTNAAPDAIGTYSQAVRHGDTVYLSGQIPLIPATMELVEGDIEEQVHQVFLNLRAVCEAAGSDLNHLVKLTVYLVNMAHFPQVNSIMSGYFDEPYPARAAIGVNQLPRGALVEIEGILGL